MLAHKNGSCAFLVSKSSKDPFLTGQSIVAKVTTGCHGYMKVFVKLQ